MAIAAAGWVLDGRYRLEHLVESSGFGEVWRATDVVLGRPVAVKMLPADRAADPEALARFRVDARRASSVVHENIARIFDYNDAAAGQPPFLVSELVDGQSVPDLLAAGPLAVPAALSVVAQVAAGIAAAHEAGLSHLDLRSANVLLSSDDGTVKVTDLGVGTGERGTSAVDLYALGVLAHECLSGEPSVTGTPAPLPAATPLPVAALIRELTDNDLASRPESAAAVARRAAALREQFAPPVTRPIPVVPATPPPPQAVPVPVSSAWGGKVPAGQVPARRSSRGRLVLIPVAAVAVVVSAVLLAGRFDRDGLPAENAIHAGRSTAWVDGAAFRNVQVSVADRRLRRLGFAVRTRWRPSATVPAGEVIEVSPASRLPLGSIVTVLGSRPAGASGRVKPGHPARNHRHQGRPAHHGGPTTRPGHSPKAGSPSPGPTVSPSPRPTGTPSPAPSQSPPGNPAPSGSPGGTPDPPIAGSPSPSPAERIARAPKQGYAVATRRPG